MSKSKKQIKEEMNRILRVHFDGSHDEMKEFFFKLAGYGLNHPKYLKSVKDAELAWLAMDDVLKIGDYLYLAYELTNFEKEQ